MKAEPVAFDFTDAEHQSAMAKAARMGLHDGMAVFERYRDGSEIRYGVVRVLVHESHDVVIRLSDGGYAVPEETDSAYNRWRPVSVEDLGASGYDEAIEAIRNT